MPERLRFVLRTPHALVLDAEFRSARVPMDSGQTGLRPREEPFVSSVQPGLVVLHADEGVRFAATAGGLLEVTRDKATLLTPFAAVGDDESVLSAQLGEALASPDSELIARRRFGEFERSIVREVGRSAPRERHHE